MTEKNDWQDWAAVMGQTQQMWMKAWAEGLEQGAKAPGFGAPAAGADISAGPDAMQWMEAGAEAWAKGLESWGDMMRQFEAAGQKSDRRFSAEEWSQNPLFDQMRQTYLAWSNQMMDTVEGVDGLDDNVHDRLKFATKEFVDAMSPANFALTNPEVLARAAETGGESVTAGMKNFFADMAAGQMTQSPEGAFELGKDLATTPGKVIYETPLFQLIHYKPTTDKVLETPLVIFPPWINRFYILDLTAEKSFVKWAVDQGVSLFMVSWKSADESIADIGMDDYCAAQVDAINQVRELLDVEAVHTIGYCVAGTVLAMTLAAMHAAEEAHRVKSATFFTAQVDFTESGDLRTFLGDETMATLEQLTAETGVLDGRVLAATFNLLRGRDLVWNYVINNYLMGKEPRAFDLLHWNSDVTNLPGDWHRDYLQRLYRENRMIKPGAISVLGQPVDLSKIKTPVYIQAGEQDHIAPPSSVWKMMDHVSGPKRFVLAGSGHIAGVVNPPAAKKYHYSINETGPTSLEAFQKGAERHEGSWWPDWIKWLEGLGDSKVEAKGARIPGKGKLRPIEDAPGRYVKTR